jgi:hypothetical protein
MRLLYDCEAPLHLVAKVQHGLPRKIVAAVDPFRVDDQFERLNDRIIVTAEQLASQCDAQLDLLYAYDLSYIYALDGGFGYQPSIMDELFLHAFSARSLRRPVLTDRLLKNAWLSGAAAGCLLLQLLAVYTPVLQEVLGTVRLDTADWGVVLSCACVPAVFIECMKWFGSYRGSLGVESHPLS